MKTNPSKTFLNLCFNKSIATEASKKFPKNCENKTTHSLAYGAIVFGKYKGKVQVGNDFKFYEIMKHFDIQYSKMNIVQEALDLINNYFNSAIPSYTIPMTIYRHKLSVNNLANKILKEMRSGKLPRITHSFYLKEYQLGLVNETIKSKKYDVVLLDESQDSNDCVISIFNNLNTKQRILVGDPHQSIYAWRGASNAMDHPELKDYKEFTLSKSFRLNIDLASNAADILSIYKFENTRLKGVDHKNYEINNVGIITRTNSKLIEKISEMIEEGRKFKTIRHPSSLFDSVIDLYMMATNKLDSYTLKNKNYKDLYEIYKDNLKEHYPVDFDNKIKDPVEFYTHLESYEDSDRELSQAGKLLKKYGSKIFEFKKIAIEYFKSEGNNIRTYITSAHTSKGLEFDRIIITDDFRSLEEVVYNILKLYYYDIPVEEFIIKCTYEAFQKVEYKTDELRSLREEFNLLYVAHTRAKYEVRDSQIENLSIDSLVFGLEGLWKKEMEKLKEEK